MRVAEYCEGAPGFVQQHEYMIYIFDATLMVLVLVVYFYHPGFFMEAVKRWRQEEKRSSEHSMSVVDGRLHVSSQRAHVPHVGLTSSHCLCVSKW